MAETPPVKRPQRNILRAANLKALKDTSLYSTIINLCIVLIFISLALFGWALYDRTHPPASVYYALNSDKKFKLRARSKPNLSSQSVMQWAIEAATTCYTLNFNNYDEVLKSCRKYFTKAGYESFIAAFKQAGVIKAVVDKKLVISAVPTGTPIIVREAPNEEGLYAWQVQFPMLVTYQSASDLAKNYLVLTLLIVQVPTTESIKGIGIAQFLIEEKTMAPQ